MNDTINKLDKSLPILPNYTEEILDVLQAIVRSGDDTVEDITRIKVMAALSIFRPNWEKIEEEYRWNTV